MFLICVSFTIAIAGTTKLPTETTLVHSILVALLHSLYYPPVHVYRVIKFLKMFDCYLHFSVVRCKYVIHDYLFINLNYNLLRDFSPLSFGFALIFLTCEQHQIVISFPFIYYSSIVCVCSSRLLVFIFKKY